MCLKWTSMSNLSQHFPSVKRLAGCVPLGAIFRNAAKPIAFCCLLLLANPGFSQKESSGEMINFTGNNYKLQYPESWTLDTSKTLGPAIFIFSPLETGEDKFRENVNILVQDLRGEDINLARYKEITDKQVNDLVTDGEIFESSILRKNNQEFYRITYAMTQGKFRVKITSVCHIQNEKAYLATFSSEIDKYDAYKETGEQILASLKLTR